MHLYSVNIFYFVNCLYCSTRNKIMQYFFLLFFTFFTLFYFYRGECVYKMSKMCCNMVFLSGIEWGCIVLELLTGVIKNIYIDIVLLLYIITVVYIIKLCYNMYVRVLFGFYMLF